MDYRTISQRLAQFPQDGAATPYLVIWQDTPDTVGLKWSWHETNPDYTPIRALLSDLLVETAPMSLDEDADLYLRISSPVAEGSGATDGA